MGRPELPVDQTVPARAELARALRELREIAVLTYDELAAETGLSAATLKRAASGRTLPAEDTVMAFGRACGAYHLKMRELWLSARIADRGRLAQLRQPGSPLLISSARELSAALEYFYEKAGAPSLRRLVDRAGGAHLLPVSSAGRIVARQALPASQQQLGAFLGACGLRGREVIHWVEAFEVVTPNYQRRNIRDDAGRQTLIRLARRAPQSTLPHVPDLRVAKHLASAATAA
ncbi:helix-turn-helix domain-containing protein [Streptomyces sp. NPDC054904]